MFAYYRACASGWALWLTASVKSCAQCRFCNSVIRVLNLGALFVWNTPKNLKTTARCQAVRFTDSVLHVAYRTS